MKLTASRTFFIALLLGLFLMTLRPIEDPDFWWHLRTGQYILQTDTIPHVDPFSFTKAGSSWITHEWLSEIIFFGLFQLGSFGLLIFTFSAIITSAFLFAYLRTPKNSRPYIAGFILLLGALATAPIWGVRPQLFSLLLSSIFIYLLDLHRRSGKQIFLIALPLLSLLWVNLHGGYFLSLVIIGIFVIGSLLELSLLKFNSGDHDGRHVNLKTVVVLCGTLAVCVVASLINPNGIKIISYPFQTLTSPSMQALIQEWHSPDFHQIVWQPLLWLILTLLGAGMVSKKNIAPTNILLILVFGFAAFSSMRNVPFFTIAAIPVLADQIASIVTIRQQTSASNHLLRVLNPILLLCITLVVTLRLIQVVQKQSSSEAVDFPKGAVDWLLENRPDPNLFNAYNWGGYIIWKAYPDYRVYIDGRADVYGDAFIFNYMSIYNAEPGWQGKLIDQNIHIVLVEPNSPLASAINQSPNWKLKYQDQTSSIFTR